MLKSGIFISALSVVLVLFAMGAPAFAEQKIGVVDLKKILNNYDEAKAAQADLQANQEKLQKILASAKQEINKAKSDKAKEEIKEKYAEKIKSQSEGFKSSFSTKWEKVESNVLSTIKQVADQEGYTLILEKEGIIAGGDDITEKVLKDLK